MSVSEEDCTTAANRMVSSAHYFDTVSDGKAKLTTFGLKEGANGSDAGWDTLLTYTGSKPRADYVNNRVE